MLGILGTVRVKETESEHAGRNRKRSGAIRPANPRMVSPISNGLTCSEIDVYGIDSHVSRFAVSDAKAAAQLMERIHPHRVFAQNNLVIKGDTETTIFPCSQVARLDLIMDGYPDWPFHHHISNMIEITEAEMRESTKPATGNLCRDGRGGAKSIHVYADFTLANAERIFVRCELRCSELKETALWNMTPLDNSLMVQHILTEPSLYVRRRGGGAILLNTAHIVRLNVQYVPTDIPNAWVANLL